ncbi:MAG: phage holin family protein [Chloroflexota bacterium]
MGPRRAGCGCARAGTGDPEEPGVVEAVRRLQAGGRRLAEAHLTLLRAELSVAGRELGIAIGMAVGILVLAVVAGLLLAIGSFLFLGEWLFGSMARRILHGVLFLAALIVPPGARPGGRAA